MRHGSLFSGIGGFETAAEWMGWTNVFHCEYNPFGQRVLKHYWPNSISYGDIKQTDFTIHRGQIDILTGGFPCQPFSAAGKRKGTEDDRHFWPEMLRAIREIQPSFVVGENVRGLLNWSGGLVFDQVQTDLETEGYEVTPFLLPACAVNAPHRRDRIWFVAHANRIGHEYGIGKQSEKDSQWRERGSNTVEGTSKTFADSNSKGRPERPSSTETLRNWKASWSYDDGRWPTQSPVCSRNDGLSSGLSGITISKHRKESIMAYGNAIVPQIALQLFRAIEQCSF